jgi:hypothetical protein
MTIELDFVNNSLLRIHFPYGTCKYQGIEHIETENIYEHIGGRIRSSDWNPINYRFVGTRYVYKVEDKKKFILLVMNTGIQYKVCDTHEPPPWD